MSQPETFSWIYKPLLGAMARPESVEDLVWLRDQGIEVLLTLTEDPLRRDWVNESGLLSFHEPMVDMEAPLQEQLDRCISVIERATEKQMGVVVHCAAGLGRTGVVVACYFVHKGMLAEEAIARARRLRPGSIETAEQVQAVMEFSKKRDSRIDASGDVDDENVHK